jgi:putative peptide zinc metalloprotease protein
VTIGPRFLEPATGVLQRLFHPWIAVPPLLAIVAVHGWIYLGQGIGSAIVGLIQQPLMIVPLFAIIVLAGIFHELGHAAALRYGGGRCRNMGFGFYLIYPALFTDTSDAYRLGRRARIRTDVGGFYFHQIFALVLVALSLVTGQAIWLLAVLVIDLEMLRQLLFPFVRFDGYWLLADLTGIPDLYTHFGAVARRRLSGQGNVPSLRPWPRRVFTVYAAVAVPVLAGLLVLFVTRAPVFLGLMWTSGQRQMQVARAALDSGDPIGLLLPVLQMLLLALPLVGGAYLVFNIARMVRRAPRALVSARASAQARGAGP